MSDEFMNRKPDFENFYRSRFEIDNQPDDTLQSHVQILLDSPVVAFPASPTTYDVLFSPSHTRLVVLSPGTINDVIECRTYQIDLGDPERDSYRALSYVCGNQAQRLPIVCGNATITVTINLYSALLRLRSSSDSVIWVDALSINQSTDPEPLRERAAQVQMMSRIFGSASEVMIDFGGASVDAQETLLDALHRFDEVESTENHDFEEIASSSNPADLSKIILFGDADKKFWKVYEDFMLRPYFRRLWVAQEFVLAKRKVLMFGTSTFRSDLLTENLMKMWLQGEVMFTVFERSHLQFDVNIKHLMHLAYLSDRYKDGEPITLLSLLDMSHTLEAYDKRDHLYALLGFWKDYDSSVFPVDYTESWSDLHKRLGKYLVNNQHLSYCLTRPGGLRGYGASWIPALWDRHSEAGFLYLSPRPPFSEYYNACAETDIQASFSHCGNGRLEVQAVQIDTVDNVSPTFIDLTNDSWRSYNPNGDAEETARILAWYCRTREWAFEQFSSVSPPYPSYTALSEAFRRTSVADCLSTEFPTEDDPVKEEGRVRRSGRDSRYFDALEHHIVSKNDDSDSSSKSDLEQKHHHLSISSDVKRVLDSISQAICPLDGRSLLSGEGAARRLGRTTKSRLCLVPTNTQIGDEIWIISGIPVPFVLRRKQKVESQLDNHEESPAAAAAAAATYVIVERCYVHDMMDGEAFDQDDSDVVKTVILE